MHYYSLLPLFRIHLISLLSLFIIIIIIIIIIIYDSLLPSLSKSKKEKKSQHHLRCGNSLLNHGNISMFNRAQTASSITQLFGEKK